MENPDNQYYLLALNRLPFVGPRTVSKLLNRWPCLADLFSLSYMQQISSGLPERLANALSKFDLSQIDADLAWAKLPDHYLLTLDHPCYPALLKEIYDPPFVLYAAGDLSCLKAKTLAIVGSRQPSVTASETARKFAFELAKSGVTIVSGLALGIDAQAHSGCIMADGRTIAVMATGIDCIYPQRHALLARDIIKKGLILSEFPLKTPPIAGHFPRRNRIISGLSWMTLVIEAAMKSGSLITARCAIEQNRDVLAVPGSIYNPNAQGCHYLLQQGAKLVTSSQDILEGFGMTVSGGKHFSSTEDLANEHKSLVKCMGDDTISIDKMMLGTGLTHEVLVCYLAELELQGFVRAVGGGYLRC